jgi:hypothetical protein
MPQVAAHLFFPRELVKVALRRFDLYHAALRMLRGYCLSRARGATRPQKETAIRHTRALVAQLGRKENSGPERLTDRVHQPVERRVKRCLRSGGPGVADSSEIVDVLRGDVGLGNGATIVSYLRAAG